jgi:Legionella pneumophila major outer membrane protein precursor
MRIRSYLLSSAALLALTIGPAAAGQPVSPSPERFPGWYFSAEGGAIMARPTASTDKTGTAGTSPQLDDDIGGYGALSFGRQVHPDSDWRVGIAYSAFADNFATTNPLDPSVVSIESRLKFQTVDVDFGFHPISTPMEDLRLFAGLRGLGVQDSADKIGSSSTNENGKFTGLGPRIGVDFENHFADSRMGFSGSLAGAAIFGERTGSINGTAFANQPTIYNVDASLGLDYHPSPAGTFTVGVRAQQWWNLRPAYSSTALTVEPNVVDWGPFVKFTWRAP